MYKKLLAAVGTLALAAGLVGTAAAPALAAAPAVNATCSAVTVDLAGYEPEAEVSDANTVQVWADGVQVDSASFSTDFSKSYSFAGVAASHSYQVKVQAWSDPAASNGPSLDTGVVTVADCAPPAAPTTPAEGSTPTEQSTPPADVSTPDNCIPDSAVSYSYDSTSNSGTITVVDVEGSTGLLCHPFYVTATSWKFTSTEVWPQVRDVVDKLPQITKPGSYDFAAAVTCGQGDIYGSFTEQPDPTPTLTSADKPFIENFLQDMGFEGPYPTSTLQDTSCFKPATVGTAIFTDQLCDTAHPGQSFSGSFTVSAGEHVSYEASISTVDEGAYQPVTPGEVQKVAPGDIVTIKIIPEAGYMLADPIDPALWTHSYPASQGCLLDSKAMAPKSESQSCTPDGTSGDLGDLEFLPAVTTTTTDASITIPDTIGVQYFIDGKKYSAGPVVLSPGVYQVTAAALPGYVLYTAADHPSDPLAYPVDGWTITLTSAEACGGLPTDSIQSINVSLLDPSCATDGSQQGSITVGQVDGVDFTPYVSYSIDGVPVTGITTPVSPGIHVVTAFAKNAGDSLEAGPNVLADGTAFWRVNVGSAAVCGSLTTLALTGSSPFGWIALGYLMLVSGLALLAVRFARRRDELG